MSEFNFPPPRPSLYNKSVLQRVPSFGLTCVFGNMRVQDQVKLQRLIKMAGRIICMDQESATNLYTKLKRESILQDSTHPLHSKFSRSSSRRRGKRLLQKKIKTDRYGDSYSNSH